MEKLLTDLSERVWITRGCRFNAHRRMIENDIYANLSIAILTVSVIVINLLALNRSFASKEDIITLLTVSLSIFVLTISQYVYARDFKSKALNYHSCACELSRLLDQIELLKVRATIEEKDITNLYDKYEDIIIKYNENHKMIDFEIFQVKNCIKGKCELPFWKKCLISFKYFFGLYFLYIFLGVVIPLLSFSFVFFS